jgi:hypothetical protein
MRLLDLPQAKHFCAPPAAITAHISSQSLPAFHDSITRGVVLLDEGTTRFQVHQVNVLNSVERWLLYSLGHYRRAMDMLVPVSAPWAQVTLYYASFFAANAILGMFGGWIGHTQTGERVVDVERGTVGSQQLRIYRRLASPSGAVGSHRRFWDFFYDAAATIAAWAPAELASGLNPVNSDFAWQIVERNSVNYDMYHAWAASGLLYSTFKPSKLKTLSGPLQLQLETAERMTKLALHFAKQISITTSLAGCGPAGTRMQIQKRLASQAPPHLVTQSEFTDLLEV